MQLAWRLAQFASCFIFTYHATDLIITGLAGTDLFEGILEGSIISTV